ncbi:uncharacterized protein F4812DRAFT_408354 [Daldinia caldariorum]|uniref:uncharacterized protein n=1 Tax=Daldinia caldariorum TaxID=326644 RepID=UPI0020077A78|nr:uncharacterized protein F4812DRAFT_408354 [Daldinia caldariorum]KAI1472310.1 hypothetical protein F4812DRAFT_408354 [Daldinia caldariorum]
MYVAIYLLNASATLSLSLLLLFFFLPRFFNLGTILILHVIRVPTFLSSSLTTIHLHLFFTNTHTRTTTPRQHRTPQPHHLFYYFPPFFLHTATPFVNAS